MQSGVVGSVKIMKLKLCLSRWISLFSVDPLDSIEREWVIFIACEDDQGGHHLRPIVKLFKDTTQIECCGSSSAAADRYSGFIKNALIGSQFMAAMFVTGDSN